MKITNNKAYSNSIVISKILSKELKHKVTIELDKTICDNIVNYVIVVNKGKEIFYSKYIAIPRIKYDKDNESNIDGYISARLLNDFVNTYMCIGFENHNKLMDIVKLGKIQGTEYRKQWYVNRLLNKVTKMFRK